MKQEIEHNYKQIKLDVVQIIEREMERIKTIPAYSILYSNHNQTSNKMIIKTEDFINPLFLHHKPFNGRKNLLYNPPYQLK